MVNCRTRQCVTTTCLRVEFSLLFYFLFIIYFNDIVKCVGGSAELVMYADDTTVYASGASVEECTTKTNGDLNNINEWMEENSSTLNTEQSTYIYFFLDLLKEVESSLWTNRDCLASLKCRTPCQNRHDYRLNHPPRKTRPKTT